MTRSEKCLERDHSSSWSHMTAPARRSGDAADGNTCTTRDLRFISLLVRSCRLLVRRRFQWLGGKSRYASASGSASSSIRAASLRRNTGATILETRRDVRLEPDAALAQSRMRWAVDVH